MADRPQESTVTLLAQVREGNDDARDRLIERYLPALQRWARGRLPGYARESLDTDDLVQVTMIRALGNLDRFEPRREGAFLAYLRRILVNALRDEIRRVAVRPARAELDEHVATPLLSPVEEAIGRERLAAYEEALLSLEERQQEAVILRLELGFSHQEVAQAIGCGSPDAARMLVSRAVTRMAQRIDAPR
jgi:RNA polymerase sigma-70 factor (ECF subfamily)